MGRVIIADGDVFNRASRERRKRQFVKSYDYDKMLGQIHKAGTIATQATALATSPAVKALTGSQSPLVKPFRADPMEEAIKKRQEAQIKAIPPASIRAGQERPVTPAPQKGVPTFGHMVSRLPQPRAVPAPDPRAQAVTQAAQTSIQAQREAQATDAALRRSITSPQVISPQVGQPQQPTDLKSRALAGLPPTWQVWATQGEGAQPRYITGTNEPILSGVKMPEAELQHLIQQAADQAAVRYSVDASQLASLATAVVEQETGSYGYDVGAISPTGPVGLWQFTYGTWDSAAKQAGAPIDRGGRLDPRISTMVAVDHLGDLLKRAGGDSGKAAAAYHGTSESQITDPEKYKAAVTGKMAASQDVAATPAAPAAAPVAPAAPPAAPPPLAAPVSAIPPGMEDREGEIRSGAFVVPGLKPDAVTASTLQVMARNAPSRQQKNWVLQMAAEADRAGALDYEFTDWTDLFSGRAKGRYMKALEAAMPEEKKPLTPLELANIEVKKAQAGAFRGEEVKFRRVPPKKAAKTKEPEPFDYKTQLATVKAFQDNLTAKLANVKKARAGDMQALRAIGAWEARFPIHPNATSAQRQSAEEQFRKMGDLTEELRNIQSLKDAKAKRQLKQMSGKLTRQLTTAARLIAALGFSQGHKDRKYHYAPSPEVGRIWGTLYGSMTRVPASQPVSPAQRRQDDADLRQGNKRELTQEQVGDLNIFGPKSKSR